MKKRYWMFNGFTQQVIESQSGNSGVHVWVIWLMKLEPTAVKCQELRAVEFLAQ